MLIEAWNWFMALPTGVLLALGVHVLMHEVPMIVGGILFFIVGRKAINKGSCSHE